MLNKLRRKIMRSRQINTYKSDEAKELLGCLTANYLLDNKKSTRLTDYEFKVYSQWGDDGIIQYLVNKIPIEHKYFIEFGVGNYSESNTRFLLVNNNWSGYVLDGSIDNMNSLKASELFWRYDIQAKAEFITAGNINGLLAGTNFENIGLLHIDLDGVDYWILKEINLGKINPAIIILEYNSLFGAERALTVPYKEDFYRFREHYSGLYWGASLQALSLLAAKKGYTFIGCNSAGNNAYFVRNDKLGDLKPLTVKEGFVQSKFRESRDAKGQLNYLRDQARYSLIKGLPVYNVETGKIDKL